MDREAINQYALKVVKEDSTKEEYTIFKKLLTNNLIDPSRLMKGCINDFYNKMLRTNEYSSKDIMLDIAIDFEISTKTVHNCVYKFPNIILR